MSSSVPIGRFFERDGIANRLEIIWPPSWQMDTVDVARSAIWIDAQEIYDYSSTLPAYKATDLYNVRPPYPNLCITWQIYEPELNKHVPVLTIVQSIENENDENVHVFIRRFDYSLKGDWLYHGAAMLEVKKDGQLLYEHENEFHGKWWTQSAVAPHFNDKLEEAMATCVRDVFFTFMFANCKNVELGEPKVVPIGRHRIKPRQKKKGPTIKRYTLDIRPMTKALNDTGNIQKNGVKMALHLCRGHFKDYRERGLFGKHKGMFWWSPQVRGSAEEGIVDKDYQVHIE